MRFALCLGLIFTFHSYTYAGTVKSTGIKASNVKKTETEASTCINCNGTNKLLTDKALQNFTDTKDVGRLTFENTFILDPMLVEQTDSRLLAEMLMTRLQGLCGKYRDPEGKKIDDDSSEIIMSVPMEALESIAKNGFKNQHQTSKTTAANTKSRRLSAEEGQILMGLPYTNKTRDLLPKYAFQVFHDGTVKPHDIPSYGGVFIRFKPEVKKRATWSNADSLNWTESPLNTNATKPKTNSCKGYCEAQIWGELDMSDVASIAVYEDIEISDSLKNIGVPIHTYDYSNGQTGSMGGIVISSKAVFSPPVPYKNKKAAVLSLEEEKNLLKTETNEVQKSLIQSRILGKTSTQDLVKSYKEAFSNETKDIADAKNRKKALPGEGNELSKERVRILAEIGAREKTQEITDLLLRAFENETQEGKSVALSGLSHLPFEKLKPLLLSGINQSKDDVWERRLLDKTVMLMSMPYSQDKDIKKALSKNKYFKKEIDKFHNGDFCTKADKDF